MGFPEFGGAVRFGGEVMYGRHFEKRFFDGIEWVFFLEFGTFEWRMELNLEIVIFQFNRVIWNFEVVFFVLKKMQFVNVFSELESFVI